MNKEQTLASNRLQKVIRGAKRNEAKSYRLVREANAKNKQVLEAFDVAKDVVAKHKDTLELAKNQILENREIIKRYESLLNIKYTQVAKLNEQLAKKEEIGNAKEFEAPAADAPKADPAKDQAVAKFDGAKVEAKKDKIAKTYFEKYGIPTATSMAILNAYPITEAVDLIQPIASALAKKNEVEVEIKNDENPAEEIKVEVPAEAEIEVKEPIEEKCGGAQKSEAEIEIKAEPDEEVKVEVPAEAEIEIKEPVNEEPIDINCDFVESKKNEVEVEIKNDENPAEEIKVEVPAEAEIEIKDPVEECGSKCESTEELTKAGEIEAPAADAPKADPAPVKDQKVADADAEKAKVESLDICDEETARGIAKIYHTKYSMPESTSMNVLRKFPKNEAVAKLQSIANSLCKYTEARQSVVTKSAEVSKAVNEAREAKNESVSSSNDFSPYSLFM